MIASQFWPLRVSECHLQYLMARAPKRKLSMELLHDNEPQLLDSRPRPRRKLTMDFQQVCEDQSHDLMATAVKARLAPQRKLTMEFQAPKLQRALTMEIDAPKSCNSSGSSSSIGVELNPETPAVQRSWPQLLRFPSSRVRL